MNIQATHPLTEQRKRHGFTLAELLIALAILGVIATFAIPKVLQAQQTEKRRALMKETIATLSQLTQEAAQTGAIVNTVLR